MSLPSSCRVDRTHTWEAEGCLDPAAIHGHLHAPILHVPDESAHVLAAEAAPLEQLPQVILQHYHTFVGTILRVCAYMGESFGSKKNVG